MSNRRQPPWIAWALALAACESAPPIVEGPVVAADSVTTEARVVNSNALPESWGASLYIVQTRTGPIVGGDTGLFTVTETGLESLDDAPVRGLTQYADEIFIARDDGLFVWEDGAMEASPINDALPELVVNAIATQGDRLWLGTDAGMVAYTDGALTQFTEIAPVHTIAAATGADYVVFGGGESESLFALAPNGDDWGLLSFAADPVNLVMPGAGTALYGLVDDQLVARVEGDTGFVWRGVAVETGGEAAGATGITALATNPHTASVWAVTEQHFIQIVGGQRILVPNDGVATGDFLVDGTDTLWASDGTTLSGFPGDEGEIVTWEEYIGPFSETNCTRCHGALATATEIYTAAQWRASIDDIIEQLSAGDMPADGAALEGGDVSLVQAWKEGGLQ